MGSVVRMKPPGPQPEPAAGAGPMKNAAPCRGGREVPSTPDCGTEGAWSGPPRHERQSARPRAVPEAFARATRLGRVTWRRLQRFPVDLNHL